MVFQVRGLFRRGVDNYSGAVLINIFASKDSTYSRAMLIGVNMVLSFGIKTSL